KPAPLPAEATDPLAGTAIDSESPSAFRDILDYVVAEASEAEPEAGATAPPGEGEPPERTSQASDLSSPLRRPPVGAAAVRPSVPKPAPEPSAWDPDLMSKTAQGARMVEEPDGSFAFEIDFSDD